MLYVHIHLFWPWIQVASNKQPGYKYLSMWGSLNNAVFGLWCHDLSLFSVIHLFLWHTHLLFKSLLSSEMSIQGFFIWKLLFSCKKHACKLWTKAQIEICPFKKNVSGLVWTILVVSHCSKSSKVIVRPFLNQHILLMEFYLEATAYVFVTVKCGDCNVEVLPPSAVPTAAGSSTMRTCNNHVTETHLVASNTERLEKQDSRGAPVEWGHTMRKQWFSRWRVSCDQGLGYIETML